jgi:translation initiation factor 3 subunit C
MTILYLQRHVDATAGDKAERAKLTKDGSKAVQALSKLLKLLAAAHQKQVKAFLAANPGDDASIFTGWGMYDDDEDDDDDDDDDDEDGDDAGDDADGADGGAKRRKPKKVKSSTAGATVVYDEAFVEAAVRKLLLRQRGTRGGSSSAAAWLKLLSRAVNVSPRAELLVLSHTVPAEFDSTTALGAAMKSEIWRDAVGHASRILALVKEHGATLTLLGDGDASEFDATMFAVGGASSARRERALLGASVLDANENDGSDTDADAAGGGGGGGGGGDGLSDAASLAGEVAPENDSAPLVISGNLGAMVERLEFEWIKAVQAATPSTPEYLQRLRDEPLLLQLASAVRAYYVERQSPRRAALLAELVLEHVYFRVYSAPLYQRLQAATPGGVAPFSSAWLARDHTALVRELAGYVYAHGAERGKTRALLMTVFHDAANGRYSEARDKLLMSYTQDTILYADIQSMVLYNRAMARLGLSAFELGLISEAHACLADLYSGHVRDLLAQGTSQRYGERTVNQERAEQQRQTPFHMWLNLDVLEAVHIVSALLLEVPNMAMHEAGGEVAGKRRVISKAFRRQLEYSERQVFSGPPESARDHALFAARSLKRGDWRECLRLLDGIQAWAMLRDPPAVRAMLGRVVRREALRTYLLRYAAAYDSLALPQLAAQFDMSEQETHAMATRMMAKDELAAAWAQPTQTIGLHGVEPTRLQTLVLQLSERTATLVESNERLFDARTGGHAYADADKDKQRDRGERRDQSSKFRKGVRGGYASSSSYSRGGGGGGRRGGYGGGGGGAQQQQQQQQQQQRGTNNSK